MKKSVKYFAFCISFLALFGSSFSQNNQPITAQNNSDQLTPLVTQPYPNCTVLKDSAGTIYVNMTLKVLPNGLLQAPEGTGIDGSTLLPFKNLTPEEVDYLEKFIDWRVAKRKIDGN